MQRHEKNDLRLCLNPDLLTLANRIFFPALRKELGDTEHELKGTIPEAQSVQLAGSSLSPTRKFIALRMKSAFVKH